MPTVQTDDNINLNILYRVKKKCSHQCSNSKIYQTYNRKYYQVHHYTIRPCPDPGSMSHINIRFCPDYGYRCPKISAKICPDTSQPKSRVFVQKVQNLSGLGSSLGWDNPGSSLSLRLNCTLADVGLNTSVIRCQTLGLCYMYDQYVKITIFISFNSIQFVLLLLFSKNVVI